MKRILIVLLISAAVLFGCPNKSEAVMTQNSNMNIADTLYYSGQFCKFSELLERANLNKVLKGKGPYTVFAPSDIALSGAPPALVQELASVENKCELNRTMRYHIVDSCMSGEQLAMAGCIKTKDGRCITVCPGCNTVKLDNANVIQTIYTKNGIIHVVDNLLMPDQQITLR